VPLAPRHAAGIDALLEDDDVRRYTRVPSAPSPGYGRVWLDRYDEGWRDGTRAGFAIEAHDGEFLGLAMFVQIERDGRQGEIGYVLAPAARGRGDATRTLGLLTDWGFSQLELERIELWIDGTNPRSESAAARSGYRQEGVLRSYWFKEDVRSDFGIWSRLRSDD